WSRTTHMHAVIFILVGSVAGAFTGLISPYFTSALARKQSQQDIQAQLAASIIDLFDDGRPLSSSLTPHDSETRRRLYLLAVRLTDDAARRSCMELVAYAGGPSPNLDRLQDAWNSMIRTVGSVYRGRGRALTGGK